MKSSRVIAYALAAALSLTSLSACQTGGMSNANIGTGAGAILGGIAGGLLGGKNKALYAVGGALLGGLAGRSIAQLLTPDDIKAADTATKKAETAPVGRPIAWSNSATGAHGTVTTVAQSTGAAGNPCRTFSSTVYAGGQTDTSTTKACKVDNGQWQTIL